MEPRIAEANGVSAPLVGWSTDTCSTPSPDAFKTAKTSPVVLKKDSSNVESPSQCSSPKSIVSNNNEFKNGDVIPYADGVKFIDEYGTVYNVDKDDSICSSGSSEDEKDGRKEPDIPDGGWGWVVVASSLFISLIADGISFSFGLLYIQFLEYFQENKSKTSWIGSLFMAVPLLSGPIMSAMVDRYGCRWMTILGGLISGIGFVLAAFGDSIEWEYMTFGVIAGLGLGLCYVTAVVSIAPWFDKHRNLAIGLGACGTGLGTIVYSPMTQYFIEQYGWRGTVLLLAGTFFNMCVCGAVMRDPPWMIEEREEKARSTAGTKSIRNASSCGSISAMEGDFPGPEEIRNMLKSGKSPEYVLTTTLQTIREHEVKDETAPQLTFRSVVNLPTFVKQKETVPLEVLQQLRGNNKLFNVILENYPPLLSCRSLSDQGKLNQLDSPERQRGVPTMSLKVKKKKVPTPIEPPLMEDSSEDILDGHIQPLLDTPTSPPGVIVKGLDKIPRPENRVFRRQFSLRDPTSHYLQNIKLHRNSVMYRGAMLSLPRYHIRASSCPNIYRNSMTTLARENEEKWYADLLDMMKSIFDFSMFLELHFLLMSLSTILLFTMFIVPYFYIADFMKEGGPYNEQDGSTLLSIIGFFNFTGMVILGWMGDQPWVHTQKAYAGCMVFCGCMCLLMPSVLNNWWLLAVVASLFGLTFASTFSFTPTILVGLISIERFTIAYGLILLCQGIGNLLGPPLGGVFRDITGHWDYSFYMAGLGIILCGILIGLIPMTKNRRIYGSGILEADRVSNA